MFSTSGKIDAIAVTLFLNVDFQESQIADVLRWLILRNSVYIHILNSLFVVLRVIHTQSGVIQLDHYHIAVLVMFALVKTIEDFCLALADLLQCLYHFLRCVVHDQLFAFGLA
jgi:hypothetical protein